MKKFFSMVLAVIFCLITLHIPAEAAMELTAPSAILIEASTGQVIYEKNATEQRSPASITKIMTLLLTFEALEDGKMS